MCSCGDRKSIIFSIDFTVITIKMFLLSHKKTISGGIPFDELIANKKEEQYKYIFCGGRQERG